MAIGHVAEGLTMPWTNAGAAAVSAGDVVAFAGMIGVATGDIAVGATGTLAVSGVWILPKNNALAVTQGDQLYWDTVNNEIDKTNTNIPAGKAYNSALLAGTEIQVILNL